VSSLSPPRVVHFFALPGGSATGGLGGAVRLVQLEYDRRLRAARQFVGAAAASREA
jgi:hypothetical protein